MYIPRPFARDDRGALFELMRAQPFALLVTLVDGCLDATHVPVVVDPERGGHGTVRFHLAGPNPAARALDGSAEALVVFTGANAYISPDWYVSEHMVPTWNYAVVHATGRPAPLDDAALARLLDDLSAQHEGRIPDKRPWTTDKLPPDRYAAMRRAIVGFEMPIERLEGKWKLGQNRTAADRAGAAAALEALGDESNRAVAALMRAVDG